MDKIWVVMYSDLDDKELCGVYSTYEKALAAAEINNSDRNVPGTPQYNPYYVTSWVVE
jgi:hypothetical protein